MLPFKSITIKKFQIQFLTSTSPISRAQELRVTSDCCIGQGTYGALSLSQNVLLDITGPGYSRTATQNHASLAGKQVLEGCPKSRILGQDPEILIEFRIGPIHEYL